MTSSNRTLPLFYLGKIFVQTNYRIMQPTSHALCKVSQASVKGHNSKQPDGNIEQMTSYSLCEAAHTSAKGHENQANDLILTVWGSTHVSQGTWKSSKWPHTHCVRQHTRQPRDMKIKQMTSYSLCEAAHTSAKGHENHANDLILTVSGFTSVSQLKGHENQANDLLRCAMLHKHQSRDTKIQQLTSYSLCDSITAWNNSTRSSQGMRPNRKSMQPTSYSLREAAYAAVKGRIGVPVLRTEELMSAGTVCGVMGVRCNSLFSLLSITFWNTNQPLNDTRLASWPQTDALKMSACGCMQTKWQWLWLWIFLLWMCPPLCKNALPDTYHHTNPTRLLSHFCRVLSGIWNVHIPCRHKVEQQSCEWPKILCCFYQVCLESKTSMS